MFLDDDLSPAALRDTFGHFPSGVAALCSTVDGAPEGIVASTFTVGVSLDPPLVMFAAQNSSRTWPLLRDSERLGVSVLAAGQADLCRQIAGKSGDRFAGVRLTTTSTGAVLLDEAALWLDCSVETQTPAGDHTVVLLRVHGYSIRNNNRDPPGALASDLHGADDLGRLGAQAAAAVPARFDAADLAFVDLDLARQPGAFGVDHGPAELVQHRPGRLVPPQAQLAPHHRGQAKPSGQRH